jgi:ABC-type polysaccharide/polyol phosphate transport system ATPase subunit
VTPVIEFEDVSKCYAVYASPVDRLQEMATFGRWKCHRDFWALQGISFQVRRGETFCVIGENGSGKSTLLQLAAGILKPTRGRVQTRGRVASLLELGAGFHPEFTGRENVYLNAAVLGLSKRQIDARYGNIAEFAGIGEFLHQPVKTYSSGMVMRLGFAIAAHCDPEILLVDEALAVGDIHFRRQCLQRVEELRKAGVTIVFVSHSLGEVKALGTQALWLDHGEPRQLGTVDEVVNQYLAAMARKDSRYAGQHREDGSEQLFVLSAEPEALPMLTSIPNIDHRHGNGRASILGLAAVNSNGEPVTELEPGSEVAVRASIEAHDDLSQPSVRLLMRNHLGLDFASFDTSRLRNALPALRRGTRLSLEIRIALPVLYPGHFSFSAGVFDLGGGASETCDWIDNAIAFQLAPAKQPIYGYLHVACSVHLEEE